MAQPDIDALYGSIALQLGLVTPDDLQVCSRLRQQSGFQVSTEQLLLQHQRITPQSAQLIRQHLASRSSPPPHSTQWANNRSGVHLPTNASGPLIAPSVALRQGPDSGFVRGSQIGSGIAATPTSSKILGSGSSQQIRLPEPGEVFGRYRIESILGQGGMGVVYKARHTDLDRVVALKMLISGEATSEKQLKRFYIEARSAARLSHPNIVRIHEVGAIEGMHYFTMDFVAGKTLHQEMAARRFPETEALEIILKLAEALDYAHANDVVHRDLKPANILIDAHGMPRITDFGIAKDIRADDGQTLTGEVLGTPAYMSPEQADGKSKGIDGRADLFSLGSILFEMLYREQAFQGTTQYAIVTKVLTVDPVPPPLERGKASAESEAICFHCLRKNRNQRYRRGKDLAADIRRVLAGKRPAIAKLRRSSSRRWRGPFWAAAGLALALGVAGGAWIGIQASERADLVEEGERLFAKAKRIIRARNLAFEQGREDARALAAEAENLRAAGRLDDALAKAAQARGLDPDSPELAGLLARCLIGLERYDEALVPVADLTAREAPALRRKGFQLLVEIRWAKRDSIGTRQALGRLDELAEVEEDENTIKRYEAYLAENDGSWSTAAKRYSELVKSLSNDLEIRARYAYALYKNSRIDEALRQAQKVTTRQPGLARAHYVEAAVQFEKKRYELALEAAKKAVAADTKQSLGAIALRERIAQRVGKPRKLPPRVRLPRLPQPRVPLPVKPVSDHKKVHLVAQRGITEARHNQAKEAQATLKELLTMLDGFKICPEAAVEFALFAALTRQLPLAKTFMDTFGKLSPTNTAPFAAAAQATRALMACEGGDTAGALNDLKTLPSPDPKLLTWTRTIISDAVNALFLVARVKTPGDPQELRRVLDLLRDLDAAFLHLQKLGIDERFVTSWRCRAFTERALQGFRGDRKLDPALALLDAAEKAHPNCHIGRRHRVDLQREGGRLAEAERDADWLINNRPSTADYALRGDIRAAQGRAGPAIEDYEKALAAARTPREKAALEKKIAAARSKLGGG